MKSNLENQVVLKKRLFIDLKRQLYILYIATAILLVLLLVFIVVVVGEPLNTEGFLKVIDHLAKSIVESAREKPFDAAMHALAVIFFIGFVIYLYLGDKHERLIISALGIQYISPLRGAFNTLYPDWFLRWEQVSEVYVQQAHAGVNTSFSTLNLATPGGVKKLQPTNWIDAETRQPPGQKFLSMPATRRAEQSFDAILKTDMVSAVRKYMPGKDIELKEGSYLFDLGSHPLTIIFTTSLLGLLVYAVIDTFFIYSDVYIGLPPVNLIITGGVLMAAIAYFLLSKANIPGYIRISLALMNGIAFGAAMHPGLLRINQFTDSLGLREYTYIRQANNTYMPVNHELPELQMNQPYEYWSQFAPGSEYVFRLRKGALGFWQLNESDLVESYREFFLAEQAGG